MNLKDEKLIKCGLKKERKIKSYSIHWKKGNEYGIIPNSERELQTSCYAMIFSKTYEGNYTGCTFKVEPNYE